MGNGFFCHTPRDVPRKDSQMKDYVFENIKMQDNNFRDIKVHRSTLNPNADIEQQQNVDYYHQDWNDMMPTYLDFISEPQYHREKQDIASIKSTIGEAASKLEARDDSTEDAESVYLEHSTNLYKGAVKDDIGLDFKIKEDYSKRQIRASQVQVIKVMGAGNPTVNGIYRWFTAHERYIMFKDQSQCQIVGGVNLSEFGERYSDCWVIEEIMENVVRLYAVASRKGPTVASDGWFCVYGKSPAPQIQVGEEWGFYEDDSEIETEGTDTSLSLMTNSYLPMQLATDGLDRLD